MIFEVDKSNEAADAAASKLRLLELNHGDDWKTLALCDACQETWLEFLHYAELADIFAEVAADQTKLRRR